MVLDAFFAVAVPLVVGGLAVGVGLAKWNASRPFYSGAEGAARRAEVNRNYGTNRGAVVIGLMCLGLYGLVVAGLIDEWGPRALTFVVAALLFIPMLTVYSVVTLLYMYCVHGAAALKRR